MDIFDQYVTPAELTGYSRAALEDRPENALILSRWFPYHAVNDLTYKFKQGGDNLLEAADFRAFDGEPTFGRRAGLANVQGDLPPIARQYLLDEFSNYTQRRANDQEFRDLFLRDAARIGREVDLRMEFARAEELVYSRVTFNENGMYGTVDFGRSSTHSPVPGVLWSDHANATPLDDLQVWRDVIVDGGDQAPGAVLASTAIINDLLRSTQVRNQVYPLASSAPQVTKAQLDQVLVDFDIPPFIRYNAQAKRAGKMQRFIPENTLVMLPADGQQLGATTYGTTLEAQMPKYGIGAADLPGLVVAAFIQEETPVQVITIGSAIGLPILAAPNATLVSTVR